MLNSAANQVVIASIGLRETGRERLANMVTLRVDLRAHAIDGESENYLAADMGHYLGKRIRKGKLGANIEQWMLNQLQSKLVSPRSESILVLI